MWSLYENGKFLEPLVFSNGKSQEDVVREVLEEIKKGKKVIFIRGACGTGKCLDKDSLIFCKPKEERYFSYYKLSEIEGKEGEIISLNDEGKLIRNKFMNVRKTGQKRLYKLVTKTGRELIVSENHPLLTITRDGPEWKKLGELNCTNYICLSNKIPLEKCIKCNENEIKILGHLIAEGKLGDKAGSPKYYQDKYVNPLIRKDYEESLKSLFPDGTIRNNHKTEVTIVFNDKDTRFGTTNKLRLLIKKHGLDGKRSNEKFVPKIIFNLNKEGIALFLSRLFSGDGCIYSRRNGQIVIEYSSISKRLIQDVSILLQRFGIQHTVNSKKFRENKEYCWRIFISNHNNLKKFIEKIGFIGEKQKKALKILPKLKEHKFTNIDKVPRVIRDYLKNKGYNFTKLDRFLNYAEITDERKNKSFKEIIKDKLIKTPCIFKQSKIDFLRIHLMEINNIIKDKKISFICNQDILWDKIKKIEFIKEDETYDLEVPELNNFIANGIIVHNSAIALNLAKELGKSSIVVPGKNLQRQYKKDYEEEKYVLKKDGSKLRISVITGRNNHLCLFMQESKESIPVIKKEVNSKLYDIFEGKRQAINHQIGDDESADNRDLPCKIEIKEKNWDKIKQYLIKNKLVDSSKLTEIKDIRRTSVASICPYWSPVFKSKYEFKGPIFKDVEKKSYMGLNGNEFIFYQRKKGCKFYEQFNSFVDSDVIVFNSQKYKLETVMDRKPLTEVEIIDECDEFLDSFSNQRTINLDRMQNALIQAVKQKEDFDPTIKELFEIIKHLRDSSRIKDASGNGEIIPLKETGLYDLMKIIVDNPETFEEFDDESYLFSVEEIAKTFSDLTDETYITIEKKDNNLLINLVSVNLAKKFNELVKNNKFIVLMSGTIHSEEVLRNIYGIENFIVLDAEPMGQGKIQIKRTGKENNFKYSNLSNGNASREGYLEALDKCIGEAKRPTLVHINAFTDMPSSLEISEYGLKNLVSRDEIKNMQNEDKEGSLIEEFKTGKKDILFSTRAARGVDFPGKQCNSIVFTKYPNPNVQDTFWRILYKTKPQHYWSFYKDKAKRELWQKVYRGLRFKEDKVEVWSPDERVLDEIEAEVRK